MNESNALPFDDNLRCCRFCKGHFGPLHGAAKQFKSLSALSPRGLRIAIDRIGNPDSHTYFECYDCEKKRKRKKLIYYAALGLITCCALLYGEINSGTLSLPWR